MQPKLNINNEVIPLQNTICQEFFLQYQNDKYIVSLKNTSKVFLQEFFENYPSIYA